MSRSESAPAAEMLALRGVYDRAVTFSKAGNQAQAASLCRQILDRDPRNVSAMALLGQIALQAGGLEGLLKLPGVAQTPAGEKRKVVTMDDLYLGSFGPRAGRAALDLFRAAYLQEGFVEVGP